MPVALRRRSLLTCATTVLLLSGCSTAHTGQPPSTTSASPHSAAATPVTYAPWGDPAQDLKADGDKILATTGRRTGGMGTTLPSKVAAGTVLVSTECQGVGTLTVDAGPFGKFTERCYAHPDGSLNATVLSTPSTTTPLQVTADPGVTWAVAVGWNASLAHPQ
ncbi:hypothetical protein EDD99_6307 [Streptomyces sp. 846.5]|nr:hypothetical protein [Streptomyces sp. 846.5]TDT98094.1 hypothetical protein EDD99_6307 [Streptomyces sp. 846.5]